MSRLKLWKQRTVEITIGQTNQGSIQFPQQDDLTNAFIVGLDLFTTNDIGSVSPVSGGTMMSVADMKLCTVTLYRGEAQITASLPLINLHSMANTSDPYIKDQFTLDYVKVSWTKCTINIVSTLSTANTIIPLSVWYLKEDDVKALLANDAMFAAAQQELINGK